MKTLLVGFGNISKYYVSYFIQNKIYFSVLSRSKKEIDNGARPYFQNFFTDVKDISLSDYSHVIIASPIETLFQYSQFFLQNTSAKILCEKPGFLNEDIAKFRELEKGRLFYGFNRRFYNNIELVKQEIAQSKVLGLTVNATIDERIQVVEKSSKSDEVKRLWLMANTSHIIDLVLFLADYDLDVSLFDIFIGGKDRLQWHKTASIFNAAYCKGDTIFNFSGFWNGTGGWSLTVKVGTERFVFENLETLHKSDGATMVETDLIKPGFTGMLNSFYSDNNKDLCTLGELMKLKSLIFRMGGYV